MPVDILHLFDVGEATAWRRCTLWFCTPGGKPVENVYIHRAIGYLRSIVFIDKIYLDFYNAPHGSANYETQSKSLKPCVAERCNVCHVR